MKETIRIISDKKSKRKIVCGSITTNLLGRINKLDSIEKQNLIEEAIRILKKCVDPNATADISTGIAIGYVQSGKTMSYTVLTTLAVENGYKVIVFFTGVKNNLLNQTTKRLKSDLLTDSENSENFKVYQSPTTSELIKIKNALELSHRPAILITVLKNSKHINNLTKIFKDSDVKKALRGTGVLIIDDEADQASLNTYARENSKSEDRDNEKFSSTYSSIIEFRGELSNHSYIQYTATPQGPLLIHLMDLLSPDFYEVLTPGKNYTGGHTFFIDNPDLIISIPEDEVYHNKRNSLSECPKSLINAIQVFLLGVAINVNILKTENCLSMMIHSDKETEASRKFCNWTNSLIDNWSERLRKLNENDPSKIELLNEFRMNYVEAVRKIKDPPSFEHLMKEVIQVLLDTNVELVIQGKTEIVWSNAHSHILIGAEMLNRGYTIEGLMVTYMPRHSLGKSNADTIQQRCRFFGYKENYLNSCRVYLPNDSILEYREYVKHEELFRKKLKGNSLDKFEQMFILDKKMNPVRTNILSSDIVRTKLNGWRQINALQNIDENIAFVDKFLSSHTFKKYEEYGTKARNHRYCKISVQETIEFLRKFRLANPTDALQKSSTIEYLRYLSDSKTISHTYIFEMGYNYNIEDGKGTILIDKFKIGNIFSGRSTSGALSYPGDKAIKFENFLNIQLHKIKLKHSSLQWNNKILYTLGIYYPEQISHTFISLK